MRYSAYKESWELKQPFRVTGRETDVCECVVVELEEGAFRGRGEAEGIPYLGETAESMLEQLRNVEHDIREGVSRHDLYDLLPPGGARNALDCALWDLEAKSRRAPIWALVGIDPRPVTTVYTIGLQSSVEATAELARSASTYPVLKIKLDTESPIQKLEAIRAARPEAQLVVDANQAWTIDELLEILPWCARLGVRMVEQPLPRGEDNDLESVSSPVPLAADESCLHSGDFSSAARKYDVINIKLDKCGGLTEALRLAELATQNGCQLMVGNMLGTSLGMAPAFVVAQLCQYVDIDGPLLLRNDRPHALTYSGAEVTGLVPELWG